MGRKAFNMFFSFLYPAADFLTITFAILFSYKVYRILGIGQYVYYEKIHIIPLSLMASFAAVIILFMFGAYKKESSLLNVEEIKNVGFKTLCWNDKDRGRRSPQ
jgi:hypothetical protein